MRSRQKKCLSVCHDVASFLNKERRGHGLHTMDLSVDGNTCSVTSKGQFTDSQRVCLWTKVLPPLAHLI
jgi:hypothetical protein